MSASRQTFELEVAEQTDDGFTTGEARSFTYQYPFVDIDSSTRTATHEPIDAEPVVQHLGPDVREITIEGHCYLDEANFIDGLSEGGLVRAVSDRWTGYAIVTRANTRATGEGGGKAGTIADRLYEYTLELSEVTENLPDSVGTVA